MRLEGKICYLQDFTKENLYDPKYFKWLQDLETVKMLYRLEYLMPFQFEEVERYVLKLFESKNDCFFAVYLKENDEFVGTLKIGHIDWRAGIGDLGMMIGEKKYWSKGIGTDGMKTALIYAFDVLGLRKITAGLPSLLIASQKILPKLGFKLEGVLRKQLFMFGEYCDHLIYGVFKDEFKEAIQRLK